MARYERISVSLSAETLLPYVPTVLPAEGSRDRPLSRFKTMICVVRYVAGSILYKLFGCTDFDTLYKQLRQKSKGSFGRFKRMESCVDLA